MVFRQLHISLSFSYPSPPYRTYIVDSCPLVDKVRFNQRIIILIKLTSILNLHHHHDHTILVGAPSHSSSTISSRTMAPTSSSSELYPDPLKTYEQHRAHSTPPSSRQHKRIDSTEFAGTGALFQPNGKQKSWPRPPIIDIPYEEATPVQYTSSAMTLEPDRVPRQRPGPLRRPWSSADAHLLSKEDVALVIEQRDRLAARAKPPGASLAVATVSLTTRVLFLDDMPVNSCLPSVRYGKTVISHIACV